MNLAIRLAIVGSLGLNLGLGYLYIKELRAGPETTSAATETVQISAPAVSTPASDIGSISDYYRQLQAVNISEPERRALVLTQLKAKHFPPPKGDGRYWEMQKLAESPRAAAQVRESLVALLGDGAWDDPTFGEFFRPLQPQLPFLSAKKQVALEQLFIVARESTPKPGDPSMDWNEHRKAVDKAAAELDGSVQKLLNAKEYSEYELRLSRLAQSLRMMGLNLSEPQYRNLYAAIRQNEMLQAAVTRTLAEPKPSNALYDHRVATILGTQQFVRFMMQCDPLYSMMNSLTRGQGVAPQAVKVAYTDLVDAQASIAKLEASADPGLKAAIDARHQKLIAALGAPAAMMIEGMLRGDQPGAGPMRTSLIGGR